MSDRSGSPASVRARLLNLARERNEEFEYVLTRYAIERLLYRLSRSAFRNKFVLKGAMLFALWGETPLLGDGVLAVFVSAREAIGAGLQLHLGIHAGDVIREADPDGRSNVYGDGQRGRRAGRDAAYHRAEAHFGRPPGARAPLLESRVIE